MRLSNLSYAIASILVTLGIIAFTGFFGHSMRIWDGGYPDTAFELTFRDASGKPLQGIELRVERDDGLNQFHRPVNDNYPGRVPTSDANGIMTFHCFDQSFGGTCETYFFVIERGGCSAPEYICRFLQSGNEVHRLRFNKLIDFESNQPRETRKVRIPTREQWGELWANGKLDELIDESTISERELRFGVVRKTITIGE